MKIFILCVLFVSVMCIPSHLVHGETLNLSTYYPAPFGAYDRLRMVPRAAIGGSACDFGMFFTNTDDGDKMYLCRDDSGTGEWIQMGVGIWSIVGDNITFTDSDANSDLSLGIGDSSPDALLEISASGGVTNDLFMISSGDGEAGDIVLINRNKKIWIGADYPPVDAGATDDPKFVIRSDGVDANTSAIEIVNANGVRMLFVREDGKTSVGITSSLDNAFEVSGSIEIEADDADSKLRFQDPGGGGDWYSMGIDYSDGGKFKINWGGDIGDGTDHFIMDKNGNVTLGGSLTVASDGTNEGEVKVIFVTGADAGYYATYAP